MVDYPEHELSPEDFLRFVELDEFADDWKKLGLNVEADLWALQIMIMFAPDQHPVIPGTGGLRKMRFAPEDWGSGKRGGIRVCYVYFPEHYIVLLVAAYGKNEKDNLTNEEKRGIRKYIKKVNEWLSQRSGE